MRGMIKKSFAVGLFVMLMTGTLAGVINLGSQGEQEPILQEIVADLPLPEFNSEALKNVEFTESPIKGTAKVIIATTDIASLAKGLAGIGYVGSIGEGAESGLAFPILEIPINALETVEGIEGVLGVYPYQEASKDLGGTPSEELSAIPSPSASSYSGSGSTIAVVDSGIDFNHPGLLDKYATVPTLAVADKELVLTPDNGTISQAFLNYENVHSDTLSVFVNGNLLAADLYTANLVTGQLDFDPVLVEGAAVRASYEYDSPYAGWPQVYDPSSMKASKTISEADPWPLSSLNTMVLLVELISTSSSQNIASPSPPTATETWLSVFISNRVLLPV